MAINKPIYSDMSKVLLNQSSGDQLSENTYDCILRLLKDPNSEVDVVTQCLLDLEQCVSCLGESHRALVNIILNMSWLNRSPHLTSVYQAFLLTLVSAHINYLKPCLRSLVKRFVLDDRTMGVNMSAEEMQQNCTQQFDHIHSVLRSLSCLVPMTSVVLPAVLEDQFPYITKPSTSLQHYSQNVLTVPAYLPSLRLQLLELVFKNLLKLDVRSSRTDINSCISQVSNMDLNEDEDDALFLMDDIKDDSKEDVKSTLDLKIDIDSKCDLKFDVKKKSEDSPKKDEVVLNTKKEEEQLATSLPLATSLDIMMKLIFKFIKETCHPNGKFSWAVTKKLYRELLSVFDKFIFPTHESVHVQFIMFYICSFREELADGFIDYLWKKVLNPSTQSVYRQTAACYIGSFISRAAYIPIRTTRHIMDLMGRWVHSYLDQTTDQHPHADIAHHGPFYAVCQALFYLFCFKHNDLIQMKRGHKWASSLKLQHIITSKLNPLRVCVPIIVKTFASVTRMHQLCYCDTIIERNNRYSLPISVASFALEKSHQLQLEAYFPFDPYLLPRSRLTVTGLYREFSGSLPDADEEEEEDEEEDDFLPDEEDMGQNSETEMDMLLGKSPMDFMQYSISPGFKHTKDFMH